MRVTSSYALKQLQIQNAKFNKIYHRTGSRYVGICANNAVMPKKSIFNVFIFNYIKNNENDLKLLQNTFEQKLHCCVQLHDQLSYTEFHKAVESIAENQFQFWNYVVIVILANRNPGREVLSTTDGRHVFINRDLIDHVERNTSLRAPYQKLLIVQQINGNCIDPATYAEILQKNPARPKLPWSNHNAANLEAGNMKLCGNTIQIKAASVAFEPLKDYWITPGVPPSPFIEAFCSAFGNYAATLSIDSIYALIFKYLKEKNEDTPSLSKICGMGDCIFGKPCSIKNMF